MKNKTNYFEGILNGDRKALAKAITLIESNLADDIIEAEKLVEQISPYSGQSIRIGISGSPGVGKSSLIEEFGSYLTEIDKKVAVIAIDPSSTISLGSILGDKTRMAKLANNEKSFIRPTPSKTFLGGTAAQTYNVILLCEAAGFEVIIIETVGVGQSEIAVKDMVDYFLLLTLAGAGDELQIIKKGIVEIADGVIITKADGENTENTVVAKKSIQSTIHSISEKSIFIDTFSIFKKADSIKLWQEISQFIEKEKLNGKFKNKRNIQNIARFHEVLKQKVLDTFFLNEKNIEKLSKLEKELFSKNISIQKAVNQFFI